MADYALATARLTYNAAALATMGMCPVWDAALSKYLAAQALADADTEYGASAAASEATEREHMRQAAKYGPAWRSLPHAVSEARKNLGAYASADDDWTRDFCEPLWAAQREFALVPAPSFAAALFKAAFLSDSEVWNDTRFPHNSMAILQADFARLAADSPRAKWDALVSRFEAIEAKPVENDEEIDEAGDLITRIMAMPAPDADAARWKLDHVLNADSGTTGSYTAEYVAQMVADYRRFLRGRA